MYIAAIRPGPSVLLYRLICWMSTASSVSTTSSASTNSVRSNADTSSLVVSGAVRKPEGEIKVFRPPCFIVEAKVAQVFNVLKLLMDRCLQSCQ
jgi:hypothetical protein